MGIPIEVPGLDTILPQVADGKIIIVESGADGAKSHFVRRVARTALRIGWPVTFITSRDGADIHRTLLNGGDADPVPVDHLRVREVDSFSSLKELNPLRGLLAVDSFSFLTLDLSSGQLTDLLRGLRAACHAGTFSALLATDRGMFDPRGEAIAVHLADGFIQFHAREASEGLVRFLRVPKWTEGTLVDRNIYYDFDGTRMAIDLRRRVV